MFRAFVTSAIEGAAGSRLSPRNVSARLVVYLGKKGNDEDGPATISSKTGASPHLGEDAKSCRGRAADG
jgi:hypothetical protein